MFSAAVFLLLLLFAAPPSASAEDSFQEYLARAEQNIKENRQQEALEALRTATDMAGARQPFLHMRLAKFYSDQGRLPEAIAQAERAVALAPTARWFRHDLAKFYLAGKQYNKAEGQLRTLLRLDPGFTSGYSCLAELYVCTRQDILAGLALGRARLLGYRGKAPEGMSASSPVGPEEDLDRPADRTMLFRFIKVASAEKAETILQAIGNGRLFEDFELETMTEGTKEEEFGVMQSNELPESLAAPLVQLRPYAPPTIVRTGTDYRILQRILPYDQAAWRALAESAALAAEAGGQGSTAAQQTGENPPSEQSSMASRPAADNGSLREGRQAPAAIAALSTLENWKRSWENADLETYLAVYSRSFTPSDGSTYTAWKEKRQKSLIRPKAIRIKISDTVMETLPDDQVLVTFRQDYESDTYRDTVIKSMTMVKETEGWKILHESIVRELPR